VITPTTELPPVKSFQVGFHWVDETLNAAPKVNVAPIPELELGAMWFDQVNSEVDEQLIFNAKYLFVEEDDKNPAIAAGVSDMTNEVDQSWYGVVSKVVNHDGEVPITINLGAASGDTIEGFFGSVKLGLHEKVDVIGEYDSSEANFAVRLRPYENITIDFLTIDNREDRVFGVGAAWCSTW